MSSNANKYAAAIFLAGLIGMTTGKVTDFLYGTGEHPGAHHEEARGYKIEVVESAEAQAGAAPAGAADISALFATADVTAGGELFAKKCAVCHNNAKGGANKVGPALYGVVGRKVASHEGFNYSAGMKSHGDKNWTADELNHFLWNPKKWVPGTIMAFAGFPKDQDRANVIAYLNSMSDAPAKLGK